MQHRPLSDLRARKERLAAALRERALREERLVLEGSLIEFFRAAWPTMDPAVYTHGWHLEAIAEHLEAIAYGQIRKLCVNMPPRHAKTLLCSVAYNAWVWAKPPDPEYPLIGSAARFMCLSYADPLAMDNSTLTHRLVASDWYQERWGHRVKLTKDQDAKTKFDTDTGGTRISGSFKGTVTGRGAGIRVYGDPHKMSEVESETVRNSVLTVYNTTLKSRITDPKTSAEILVAQRGHEKDLTAEFLDDPETVHLNLPAEYDSSRHCVTVLGWEDPRTIDGELLWPERFGKKELATFKRDPYEWNAQWQQKPEVRGGGIFKRDQWQLWEGETFPQLDYIVASADTAYTQAEQNDPTGFVIFGSFKDVKGFTKLILLTAWRKRLEIHGHDTERRHGETEGEWIKRTQKNWGLCEWLAYSCKRFKVHRLIIEGKASGLSVAQEMRRLHSGEGWSVHTVTPEGDKVARAYAVQSLFSDNMIYAPDREWAQMVIDEMASFPKGTFKDLTDATTQVLKHFRDIGLAIRREERDMAEEDMARHKPRPRALYPA